MTHFTNFLKLINRIVKIINVFNWIFIVSGSGCIGFATVMFIAQTFTTVIEDSLPGSVKKIDVKALDVKSIDESQDI